MKREVIGNRKLMVTAIELADGTKKHPDKLYERLHRLYPALDDFTLGVIVGMDFAYMENEEERADA